MKRRLGMLVAVLAICLGITGTAAAAPNADNASCMGLGSSFYAHMAPGQRADVQHLVKEFFAEAPGTYLRNFAHEKEGGSIPAPCGSRIE